MELAEFAPDNGSTLSGSIAVVMCPALLMLVGGALAAVVSIPERFQACMQNFSGGLLISAVAGELFPLMSTKGTSVYGLCAGFMLGLVCMFGLGHLTESTADEEDDSPARKESDFLKTPMLMTPQTKADQMRTMADFKKEADLLSLGVTKLDNCIKDAANDGSREAIDENLHSLMYQVDRARRRLRTEPLDGHNLRRMGDHMQELRENHKEIASVTSSSAALRALDAFEKTLEHIHEHSDRVKFRRWKLPHMPEANAVLKEIIPWPLVFAVCVDSGVDGFLIGLAYAAATSAGWCMSVATSIEMGFLGLSFAATLRNATRSVSRRTFLVVLPPMILSLSGLIGNTVGQELKDNQVLFTGFIAFSVVALLFLVTQELLAEAREVAGDDLIINSIFFFGLFAGILLERFVG